MIDGSTVFCMVTDGTAHMTSEATDRWATMFVRDCPRDRVRYPSYRVVLSDGRVIAGEMSFNYAQTRAVEWVAGGV